jgi:hypothetical protein
MNFVEGLQVSGQSPELYRLLARGVAISEGFDWRSYF